MNNIIDFEEKSEQIKKKTKPIKNHLKAALKTIDTHKDMEDIEEYKKALKYNDMNLSIYLKLSEYYKRIAMYEESIYYLELATHKFPFEPMVYEKLSIIYVKLGYNDLVLKNIKKARDLLNSQETRDIQLNLEVEKKLLDSFVMNFEYGEVIKLVETINDDSYFDSISCANIGSSYEINKKFDEAIKWYERSLVRYNGKIKIVDVVKSVCNLYINQGEFDKPSNLINDLMENQKVNKDLSEKYHEICRYIRFEKEKYEMKMNTLEINKGGINGKKSN